MEPFPRVSGPTAALPLPNIDTDVIVPKQFPKGIDCTGLDRAALHELRFDADGHLRPNFVLNQLAWRGARFLVVGPNFGCGSSREHAVWGLLQLGIRAVIGTSFAGIFADNAANNGLLLLPFRSGTSRSCPGTRLTRRAVTWSWTSRPRRWRGRAAAVVSDRPAAPPCVAARSGRDRRHAGTGAGDPRFSGGVLRAPFKTTS